MQSSSHQSMNTFNEYTISSYTKFIQVRGQQTFYILKYHLETQRMKFQHFILDFWDDLMHLNVIVIDIVICFSNMVHPVDNKQRSNDELKDLFYDMRDIDYAYHVMMAIINFIEIKFIFNEKYYIYVSENSSFNE